MPTYTYSCIEHKRFTTFKRMSEMLLEEPCPKCGTPSPKQMDRGTFILKGSGWTPKPDPKIPDKFLKMSDSELNSELGIPDDCIC